jgi:hypothetical protein
MHIFVLFFTPKSCQNNDGEAERNRTIENIIFARCGGAPTCNPNTEEAEAVRP